MKPFTREGAISFPPWTPPIPISSLLFLHFLTSSISRNPNVYRTKKRGSSKRRTSFCRGPKRGPDKNGGSMGVIEVVQVPSIKIEEKVPGGRLPTTIVRTLVGTCRDRRFLRGIFHFSERKFFVCACAKISTRSLNFPLNFRASENPGSLWKFRKILKNFSKFLKIPVSQDLN